MSRDNVFDILKHPLFIENTKVKALSYIGKSLDSYRDKNVFMIKNSRNLNVVTKYNTYTCNKIMEELRQSGWIIINPEAMNMFEIIAYLSLANKIVTSYGGIFYGNGIFFNRYCEKFIILNDTKHEKLYFWDTEFIIIYKNNTNLDKNKEVFYREIKYSPSKNTSNS